MKTAIKLAMTSVALAGISACSKPAVTTNTAAPMDAASPTTSPADSAMRIRGTAQTVSDTSLTLQGYDGQPSTVSLGDKTAYAWVVPAKLSSLKNGDFIGTATTGEGADMKALEVVIFPESMRGTGEGHYDWQMPSAVANADQPGANGASAMTNGAVVQGAMTNGTVQNGAMTNGTVQGAMTNGAVKSGAGATGKDGETHLTISYKGGTADVMVPKNAPIVRFEPTKQAMLAKGQKVFVVAAPDATGTPAAQFVAIGKDGLMPPM